MLSKICLKHGLDSFVLIIWVDAMLENILYLHSAQNNFPAKFYDKEEIFRKHFESRGYISPFAAWHHLSGRRLSL